MKSLVDVTLEDSMLRSCVIRKPSIDTLGAHPKDKVIDKGIREIKIVFRLVLSRLSYSVLVGEFT